MRALMESLCWILAAMTVGLHEAIARLQPRKCVGQQHLFWKTRNGGGIW
ncbi:unnamed protein product [Ectocarpus sp. 12 AP-2014]